MAPDEQFLTSLVVTGDVTNNTVTLLPEVSTTEDTYTFNMHAENVTIAATFASNYIIQFSVNGTIDNDLEATVAIGGSTMLPTSVTPPAGFAFAGWTTNESNTATILTGNYSPSADMTMYAVFSITVTGEEEEHVVILDGAGFESTAPSSLTPLTTGGFSYKYIGARKVSVPGGISNCFVTGYAIYIGSGNYIYNTTEFGDGITKFEVYANKGASTSVAVGINFSTSAIDEYNASASNTWTQSLNPADKVYDASSALPTGAKYFWYQTTSGNAQVQFRITYTTTGSTTNYYTRVFTKEIAAHGADGEAGWYLIASPLAGETDPTTIEGMIVTDDETTLIDESKYFDLYRFSQNPSITSTDEGDKYLEWENYKVHQNDTENPFKLVSGQGYLYANANDVILTFAGIPYSGDSTVTLSKVSGVGFSGWNLIGNPLASNATIDVEDFYRMNYGDNTGGDNIIVADDEIIAPMEGVFVIAEENEQTVKFTKLTRATESNRERITINLGCNGGTVIDRAIVRFGEGRTLPKFMLNPSNTKVYIPQDNKDYSVVRSNGQGEMPVNFRANADGQYTLTVNPEGIEMGYLHLIDNMTGANIDLLSTPAYTFNAKTTDYESRFRLVFSANNANTDAASEDTFAFFSNGNLIVNNEGEATLQVVDVMGRVVSSQTVSGTTELSFNQVPGVYVLRLVNGNDVKTQKIVVR
jgi:hypothetical protein